MMHQRGFSNPPIQPQSECGGLSVIVGAAIVFFVICVGILHIAFTARDADAAKIMWRIEAGIFVGLAAIGCLLALIGLRQRDRRHSAAKVGLAINGLLLAGSVVGFLVA